MLKYYKRKNYDKKFKKTTFSLHALYATEFCSYYKHFV